VGGDAGLSPSESRASTQNEEGEGMAVVALPAGVCAKPHLA
jgi:hypothetical protein